MIPARQLGSVLEPLVGQVPGTVVAAAFGVFNPEVVVPVVELGWTKTDAPTICAARTEGAVGQLRRILGDEPAHGYPASGPHDLARAAASTEEDT